MRSPCWARSSPSSLVAHSLLSAGAAWRGWLVLAALGIQLRLLCNMLDGMVAVEHGRATPVGALYNDVPDRSPTR